MTRAAPHILAQQLGRHWAANTAWAGGLTFCEPDASAPSNLYAAPLPQRGHRLSPAASITLTPAAASEPAIRLQAIDLVVEAHAETDALALELLTDLHELLFPTDGPFVHHAEHFGQDVSGVVGIPDAAPDPVWLFRIVTLEPGTGPVVVPGGGETEIRTSDGDALATLTLSAACTPRLIDWWS